jgi:hypothetical protein
MPIVQVTYSNGSKSTLEIDPPDIRKVSIDHGRPLDIRVRVVLKSAGTPIDLFFHKPNAPVIESVYSPLVSHVTVFTTDDSMSLDDPDTVYGTMSNWMLFAHVTSAPVETGGTEAPQE